MFYTDDPESDFNRWAAKQTEELSKFPLCSHCGGRILDDYLFEINDEYICENCMHRHYRKWTVDCCEG